MTDSNLKYKETQDSPEYLSPDAAEYLNLFMEMISDYEVEPYVSHPDLLDNCFPQGLDEDQNELIALLKKSNDISAVKSALTELFESLESNPVQIWALRPIFEYFDIKLPGKSSPGRVRYRLPNLVLNNSDQVLFFTSCGFEADSKSGKGSHVKWTDPSGQMNGFVLSYEGSRFWLKNVIKDLLDKGMSLDRIHKACLDMNIAFEIL